MNDEYYINMFQDLLQLNLCKTFIDNFKKDIIERYNKIKITSNSEIEVIYVSPKYHVLISICIHDLFSSPYNTISNKFLGVPLKIDYSLGSSVNNTHINFITNHTSKQHVLS